MKIRCISAGIYVSKQWGNASNSGMSTRFDSVLIPAERGNIEVDTENPPENFVSVENRGGGYLAAVCAPRAGLLGPMAGGCLVYCSDSRFPALHPLPLHDRFETQAEYNVYSA